MLSGAVNMVGALYLCCDEQHLKNIPGDHGIISFHILGRRMVVINSAAVAKELLSKRGGIYSDRNISTMGRLTGREKSMLQTWVVILPVSFNDMLIFRRPYDHRLKEYRRLMQQSFNPVAVRQYDGTVEYEAKALVDNILKAPENHRKLLRQ